MAQPSPASFYQNDAHLYNNTTIVYFHLQMTLQTQKGMYDCEWWVTGPHPFFI